MRNPDAYVEWSHAERNTMLPHSHRLDCKVLTVVRCVIVTAHELRIRRGSNENRHGQNGPLTPPVRIAYIQRQNFSQVNLSAFFIIHYSILSSGNRQRFCQVGWQPIDCFAIKNFIPNIFLTFPKMHIFLSWTLVGLCFMFPASVTSSKPATEFIRKHQQNVLSVFHSTMYKILTMRQEASLASCGRTKSLQQTVALFGTVAITNFWKIPVLVLLILAYSAIPDWLVRMDFSKLWKIYIRSAVLTCYTPPLLKVLEASRSSIHSRLSRLAPPL